MSRNSKNARLHQEAKARKGQKGPARTEAKHGKVNVKWKSKEVVAARQAVMTKTVDDRSVLEKLKGVEA
jgi:hypothetical protein